MWERVWLSKSSEREKDGSLFLGGVLRVLRLLWVIHSCSFIHFWGQLKDPSAEPDAEPDTTEAAGSERNSYQGSLSFGFDAVWSFLNL